MLRLALSGAWVTSRLSTCLPGTAGRDPVAGRLLSLQPTCLLPLTLLPLALSPVTSLDCEEGCVCRVYKSPARPVILMNIITPSW